MFYLKQNDLIVRKLASTKNEIYLTFDDGPNSEFTPQVLDILAKEKWPVTFFVIGKNAGNNRDLIKRMQSEGHSILSHSFDHNYSHYFRGKNHLKTWLRDSMENLNQTTGHRQNIFRPPAGILTPPLLRAAAELKTPLILWQHRFYDTAWALSENKILKNLKIVKAGDIVLLHDRPPKQHRTVFVNSLTKYIHGLKALGFVGNLLSESRVRQHSGGF